MMEVPQSLLKNFNPATPSADVPASSSVERSLRVYIRARPLPRGDKPCWELLPTTLTSTVDGTQFALDGAFGEFWSTDKIYTRLLTEPVSALLDGYNLTLFAYGQTGSGKTHTMLGNSTEHGLLQLAVQQLFEDIRARKEAGWQCTATLSAIEIYMGTAATESLRDLVDPSSRAPIRIRETKQGKVWLDGLQTRDVCTSGDALALFQAAAKCRETRSTSMNHSSSRSHALFMLRIQLRAPGASHSMHSTLTLGDLAGSERARAAGTSGAALKEGSNINKSLHHLGEVILSLKRRMTQRQGTPSHVPYRHSKLTHILKPSLGGNSNTMVFCTVSLANGHYSETVSTLKFATHAKSVKVAVSSNVKLDVQQRLQLQQQEIERLRRQLNFKECDSPAATIKAWHTPVRQSDSQAARAEFEARIGRLRQQLQAREDDLEATVGLTLETRRELEELRSRFIQLLTENTCLKRQLGIMEEVTASQHLEIGTLQGELDSVRSYAETLSHSMSKRSRDGSVLIGTATTGGPVATANTPGSCTSDARGGADEIKGSGMSKGPVAANKENSDSMQLRRSVSLAAALHGAAQVLMGSPRGVELTRGDSVPSVVVAQTLMNVRPYTGSDEEDCEVETGGSDGWEQDSEVLVAETWPEELTLSVMANKGTPLAERLRGLMDSELASPVRTMQGL